ncbi:MAG: glycosyltransferase family 1 protein, partial [Anaerolineales bacterium]|nr:glycosyltransferase family 1 protein [Anaerolineales bacterium]
MNITILAVGSQGDVQPYLALAVGLKNEGYKVTFAANSNFAGLAASYNLKFFPIRMDSFKFVQNSQTQSWLDAESIFDLVLSTNRVVRPMLGKIMMDVFAACQGSEAIIYHSYALPFVHYFGKQFGIPCIPASLHPMPTRSYPAILSNIRRSPSKTLNLLTHLLVHQISWQVFLPVVRKHWSGQNKVPAIGPYREILKGREPILCGYSPLVLPKSEDLPAHVNVTGYWFLDPHPNWQPEPALIAFLKSTPRPIYIGFGSMGNPAKNQDTANTILEALAETNQRAVLSTGWSGLGADQPLPKYIFLIKNTPHRWLFPQMAAVVHHGGAGTTGAALSAGVPNIVIPHFGDQY